MLEKRPLDKKTANRLNAEFKPESLEYVDQVKRSTNINVTLEIMQILQLPSRMANSPAIIEIADHQGLVLSWHWKTIFLTIMPIFDQV